MDVVVAGALRTPVAQRAGGLKDWHAADLLGRVLAELPQHGGVTTGAVDAVIGACSTAVGEQALNVTRSATLAAGWPEDVPAITFEGGAIAGLHALQHGRALIASEAANVVVVAGVESASRVPAGASTGIAVGKPFGPGVHARYAPDGGLVAPAVAVERMAQRFGVDRADMDQWASLSRTRWRAALESGVHKDFVVPVPRLPTKTSDADAWTVEDESSTDVAPADLKPLFEVDGTLTAANMAQPGDGAVGLVLMSSAFAEQQRANIRARLRPVVLSGNSVLEADCGWRVAQRAITQFGEVNSITVREDSAVVPLAFAQASGRAADGLNVDGGALATADVGGAGALIDVLAALARLNDGQVMTVCAGPGTTSGAVALSR